MQWAFVLMVLFNSVFPTVVTVLLSLILLSAVYVYCWRVLPSQFRSDNNRLAWLTIHEASGKLSLTSASQSEKTLFDVKQGWFNLLGCWLKCQPSNDMSLCETQVVFIFKHCTNEAAYRCLCRTLKWQQAT